MEFQLKYDSFRICFCSKESEWGVVFHGLRRQGSGRRGGSRTVAIFSSLYSPFSHLSTHSTPTPPHPPSKGNDLAETLFVQRHSAVRAWSQAKMGCYDKGLCVEKSKKEPLVDRLLPRTITLPAVPNRRLQEISAKKGCSAQTGGELVNWERAAHIWPSGAVNRFGGWVCNTHKLTKHPCTHTRAKYEQTHTERLWKTVWKRQS